eukprot:2424874-Amphidinium_carterae.2
MCRNVMPAAASQHIATKATGSINIGNHLKTLLLAATILISEAMLQNMPSWPLNVSYVGTVNKSSKQP